MITRTNMLTVALVFGLLGACVSWAGEPYPGWDPALHWLAYHQEADGHWDAKKYGAEQKTDTACTGFALLAFLGAGHTEKVGEYKGNVQRAVAWLKSKQNADGCIWDTTDANAHQRAIGYPCAIATLAMAEAAGMANIPETRAAAQNAINYCTEKHQVGEGSDKGAWRYGAKEAPDLSVTGWFVMALKSAKVAGLHVNPASFDGAIKFLDTVEKKESGGGGGYGPASHYEYQPGVPHDDYRASLDHDWQPGPAVHGLAETGLAGQRGVGRQ